MRSVTYFWNFGTALHISWTVWARYIIFGKQIHHQGC